MPIVLNILSKFDAKGISNAQSGFDQLHASVRSFSRMSAVAFAAASAAAIAFGISSMRAAADSEAVSRSLLRMAENSDAFAATTPNVGKAVDEIMTFTKRLSNLYGIDDEILNGVVRGWMAVPDLAGKGVKGIEKMVQVVADVAAGTGKDIESLGMAFIKVAGDEETALSKLLRQGIVFTDQQKEQYRRILDTNGEIEAQNYLIDELGRTYAGTAAAAANPFAVLEQQFQNTQEQLGVYLLPALENLTKAFQKLIDEHGPQLEEVFKGIGDVMVVAVDAIGGFADWYADNPDLFNNLVIGIGSVTAAMWLLNFAMDANPVGLVILGLASLVAAIAFVSLNLDKFSQYFSGVWDMLAGNITQNVENIVNMFVNLINNLIDPLNALIDLINTMGGSLDRISKLSPADFGGRVQALRGAVKVGGAMGLDTSGVSRGAIGGIGGAGRPRFMAEGGIVTGATSAIIGEAGPEAVIPLDRIGSLGGDTIYNINVSTGVGDPVAIGQQVVSYIKRFERANGAVFAGA